MGLTAEISIKNTEEDGATLTVSGKGLGSLIGRHGEVLDSLQYLATLAANIEKKGFYRVTVDVQGYREKRAETLRGVAKRMSEKVLKYKKSVMLEPMNPYERRITHSEIQNMQGVSTNSIGSENNRKIVIFLDGDN